MSKLDSGTLERIKNAIYSGMSKKQLMEMDEFTVSVTWTDNPEDSRSNYDWNCRIFASGIASAESTARRLFEIAHPDGFIRTISAEHAF